MTKGKKIALIAVSAVVALIVIAVIVLAIVQSNFKTINVDNASALRIYINGEEISVGTCTNPDVHTMADNEGQRIYKNITEKSANNSKESVLTCIISGAYGFENVVTEEETTKAAIKEAEIVIEYVFDSEQTLTINGEEQTDSDGNKIKYTRLYMEVKDTTDLTETYVYLLKNKNDSSSKFKVSFLAKQAELYEYIMAI